MLLTLAVKLSNSMYKFSLIAIFVAVMLFSCVNREPESALEDVELINRSNLKSFLEKIWNEKDLSAIDSFFSDSLTRQVNSVNLASNKNELTANLQVYFTGFPDLKIKIDNMASEGQQVYISWTLTGTNTGVFGELQPTGKKIKISGISRTDFNEAGKIIHEEVFYNELSLLQQMGHTLNPPILE